MAIIVFFAVVLIVGMYMTVLFSLKPNGIKGIVSGLIPSIALSIVTWYIKKKLQNSHFNIAAKHQGSGRFVNERSRASCVDSDEHTELLPGE